MTSISNLESRCASANALQLLAPASPVNSILPGPTRSSATAQQSLGRPRLIARTAFVMVGYLITVREADRATEFRQRCKGLRIEGVTLHSYRYAWAERAKVVGYPERFAQEALGHNSKAVHRAYAKNAQVVLPSLGSYEKKAREQNIVPFPKLQNTKTVAANGTGG